MSTFGPEALAALYRSGLTLRGLGQRIGRSHTAVRYQLRKVKGYRAMVTRMLLQRVRKAQDAYSTTRAREHRRRMKHALATLRQCRPAVYAQMIERSRPKCCSECSRKIDARAGAGLWHWTCNYCGAGDFVPVRAVVRGCD